MNESGIEWIRNPNGSKGLTTNPVIGCSRISPGCGGGYIKGPNGEQGGCWAESLVSTRMSKNPKLPTYHDLARPDGEWSGVVKLVPERLKEIVALGKARKKVDGTLESFASRVFVCDLSDLFHDKVPFEYIAAVFGAMACAPQHLFYVLTKRPARAVEFARWIESDQNKHRQSGFTIGDRCKAMALDKLYETFPNATPTKTSWAAIDSLLRTPYTPWPLPNVVFGVTVEDRRYGLPRLELARQFPARYHWVSVEPLLEDLGDVDFTGFDLAVVGAESGPGHRPFDVQWARNVKAACHRSKTRVFWKQGPGGDTNLDHAPEDLRIRENLPMP